MGSVQFLVPPRHCVHDPSVPTGTWSKPDSKGRAEHCFPRVDVTQIQQAEQDKFWHVPHSDSPSAMDYTRDSSPMGHDAVAMSLPLHICGHAGVGRAGVLLACELQGKPWCQQVPPGNEDQACALVHASTTPHASCQRVLLLQTVCSVMLAATSAPGHYLVVAVRPQQ